MFSLLLRQRWPRVPVLPTWMRLHHRHLSQFNMVDSSSKGHGETVREATLADFQAVMDIEPNAYFGLDYLPSTYQSLLERPGVKAYVCEKAGGVVAFMNTHKVDGGRTLVLTGARVKEEYRGQDLMGRFWRLVLADVYRAESPNLKHMAFTIPNQVMDVHSEKLLRLHRLLAEKTITSMEVDFYMLRSAFRSRQVQPPPELKMLSYRDIHTMLQQSPAHLSHLFPQQRMVLTWTPYRIMADNADFIFTNNRVFLARDEELSSLASWDKGSNFPLTLMSSGITNPPCKRGYEYCLDIFGSGNDADLRAHFLWHLHHFAKVREEMKAVVMVSYKDCLAEVWADIRADFPNCLHPTGIPYQKMFLLESELSTFAD